VTTRPNPDAPIVGSAAHELQANLNFSERGLSDSMAAYWALCKLIREHDGGTESRPRFPGPSSPIPARPSTTRTTPRSRSPSRCTTGPTARGTPQGASRPIPSSACRRTVGCGSHESRSAALASGKRRSTSARATPRWSTWILASRSPRRSTTTTSLTAATTSVSRGRTSSLTSTSTGFARRARRWPRRSASPGATVGSPTPFARATSHSTSAIFASLGSWPRSSLARWRVPPVGDVAV